MNTSGAISMVAFALSVGLAVFKQWETIKEIFSELTGNRPTPGVFSEEVFETLRREREAENKVQKIK